MNCNGMSESQKTFSNSARAVWRLTQSYTRFTHPDAEDAKIAIDDCSLYRMLRVGERTHKFVSVAVRRADLGRLLMKQISPYLLRLEWMYPDQIHHSDEDFADDMSESYDFHEDSTSDMMSQG
eukprot:910186_1